MAKKREQAVDRRRNVLVKLNDDQHKRLHAFAERRGLSLGQLLRTCALELESREAPLS